MSSKQRHCAWSCSGPTLRSICSGCRAGHLFVGIRLRGAARLTLDRAGELVDALGDRSPEQRLQAQTLQRPYKFGHGASPVEGDNPYTSGRLGDRGRNGARPVGCRASNESTKVFLQCFPATAPVAIAPEGAQHVNAVHGSAAPVARP